MMTGTHAPSSTTGVKNITHTVRYSEFSLARFKRRLSGIQASFRFKAFSGMMLNCTERRIYWIHEEIDRRIGRERIPAELRVEPLLPDYALEPRPIASAV
jgi:hypothetical protein